MKNEKRKMQYRNISCFYITDSLKLKIVDKAIPEFFGQPENLTYGLSV